ncbi:nitroreductase family protein [Pontiella sulfatireligans]|uniref:Albonoursin synthase n=1 Tax=Pontiella sulfatireligans TaxID=2750658 RepID=A0A6C2ULR9_9BACT|nr:nitroreductase family protein [Pontiella sulfatireligans]VGO21205.1 Albonoursin synthase [Pontiella sulfatireligans]
MKFIELAEKRCSIRSFKPDPVPDVLLNEVLTAGSLAPTAKNLQPFQFIVVRAESGLDALSAAYPAPFLREAPVVIVVCVEAEKGWVRKRHDNKNYAEVDAAIAADHMTLAAADLGLGTCWIGAFDPGAVSEAMGLPDGVEPITMLPLGYPNMAGLAKIRKPLEDLVRYEHW